MYASLHTSGNRRLDIDVHRLDPASVRNEIVVKLQAQDLNGAVEVMAGEVALFCTTLQLVELRNALDMALTEIAGIEPETPAEAQHDVECEAEFLDGPKVYSPCGCEDRERARIDRARAGRIATTGPFGEDL